VLGQPVLSRLLAQALAIAPPDRPIAVHAREDDHPLLTRLVADSSAGRVVFVAGPPLLSAAILRTDRLYDTGRLRRAVRRGRSPEAAVIWRLDRIDSLAAADEELTRRLTYQPLGRYWAFPMAERMAAALAPTRVRPNALTLLAAGLMLAAAVVVALGWSSVIIRLAAALAMALALVLDTADGRLARLQGTTSAFGRWLDQVLDELADLALHAAIAWAMFQGTGNPLWLLAGIAYSSGKYLFMVQSQEGTALDDEVHGARLTTLPAVPPRPAVRAPSLRVLRSLVAMVGHADLRWHLWIVLAALGRLDLALLAYAAYFPLRALAGGLRKAVAHG
jgi:phosphatidylglycerophosphate synthase